MAGASGAGKSTTINSLFEDKSLCKTSPNSSGTNATTLVTKALHVTAENPTLCGNLSFIDIPGTFDTDSTNEAINMASIRKIKNSCVELVDRYNLTGYVREHVYPNLVLFVVSATDNRTDGPSSNLVKSLESFKASGDFVDHEKINLIVVVSHAGKLGLKKETFERKLEAMTRIIQKHVLNIFGIHAVEVVPVENEPEEFLLTKSGDFYLLPNDAVSHLNLFESMHRIFTKNEDKLGSLFTSWYFLHQCPEKTQPAQTRTLTGKLSRKEIELAGIANQRIGIVANNMDDFILKFPLGKFGYGYCPVTEEFKMNMPITFPPEMSTVLIDNSRFAFPQRINVNAKKSKEYQRLSFMDKKEYQHQMKVNYGLDLYLGVTVNPKGRWLKSDTTSTGSCTVKMVYDIKLATLSLENPTMSDLSPSFAEELEALPDEYNQETRNSFAAFFNRWGTHLVAEQPVGGTFVLGCTFETGTLTEEKLKEVEAKACKLLTSMFGQGNGNYMTAINELRQAGISSEILHIDGGDPPQITSLDGISPEKLMQWENSLSEKPGELLHSKKLYPYYNFLKIGDQKHGSFYTATLDYLDNSLKYESENNRDDIANEKIEDVVKDENFNCFPGGSMVTMEDGNQLEIEHLDFVRKKLQTLNDLRTPLREVHSSFDVIRSTEFCTYLDRKEYEVREYLVLEFDNGRKLTASPGHMIFEFRRNARKVIGKQAKHFKVGDQAVCIGKCNNGDVMSTPKLVKISKELRVGAYAPLTTTGTLIVDGFFVSSYAHINSFQLGQVGTFPLKVWSKMKNDHASWMPNGKMKLKRFEGIHPYAKFLMPLREPSKYFLDKLVACGQNASLLKVKVSNIANSRQGKLALKMLKKC